MIRLILLFFLLFGFFVHAEQSSVEVILDKPDVKEAIQLAVNQVSFELMGKFIAPTKLEEQKKALQKVISTYSNRYILYTKTSKPKKQKDNSFLINVTVGFSEANLKKILLAENLFYSSSFNLRILPVILFEDRVEREAYSWLVNRNNNLEFIKEKAGLFYNKMQDKLLSYGFYLMNPEFANLKSFVPEELRLKRPKKKDIFELARFFKSHLVLIGVVKLRESARESVFNLKIDMDIYHTETGRLLAEMERSEKINLQSDEQPFSALSVFLSRNKNFVKGLGVQLKSIYEMGQMSANVLKITVYGIPSYEERNKFKKRLLSKISSIKNLQEHIIRWGSITYIVHTTASIDEIERKLEKISFLDFSIRDLNQRKNEIILKVVVRS